MLITYQEAIFTVPTSNNRYDIHKMVTDTYTMGAPFDIRSFIYDVRVLSESVTAITLRENVLPPHFNPTTKNESFVKGDERKFMLAINLVRRSGKKEQPVGCIPTFIMERLASAGWGDVDIKQYKTHLVPVKKKNHRLNVFMARAEITARVVSPEKVSETFMHGIGRAKGFGLGMMMLQGE
jgi:hypothetical protein